jgi:hypothetical protein
VGGADDRPLGRVGGAEDRPLGPVSGADDRPLGRVSGGGEGGPGSGLVAEARALGALRWLELRCFEVVGAWAADGGPPEVRVLLATLSSHHAWRADLVRSRLPLAAEVAADVVTAPSRRGRALAEALAALADDAVARLAVSARVVLPGLATAYEDLAVPMEGLRHDAMGRIVRMARDDARADWWSAARTLARHLDDTPAVARAAQAVASVESALVTT